MNGYHTDEEVEIRIHSLYFSDPCYFSWILWYSAIFPEKKKKEKIQKAKHQPPQKTKTMRLGNCAWEYNNNNHSPFTNSILVDRWINVPEKILPASLTGCWSLGKKKSW